MYILILWSKIISLFCRNPLVYGTVGLERTEKEKSVKTLKYCFLLRIRSIFFGSGSVNPVFKIRIRIRIRVTQQRPDPTGSGAYLDTFLMFSKINIFYGIFLPNLIILWHLKSKIKNILTKLYIRQFSLTRKLNYRGLFVNKGSGKGSATLVRS